MVGRNAVERLREERDVEGLIEALGHPDKATRIAAAEALGDIKDPDAVAPLIEALKDELFWVRRTAVEALGEIGDSRAVEPLLNLSFKDENWHVRCAGVIALEDIGEPAVDTLISTLQNEDPMMRLGSARVLGEIGDPRAVGPLKSMLGDREENVRNAAKDSLIALEHRGIDID